MNRIRQLFRWWVAVTSQQEPPTVLACFRILVGLVMLGSLVSAASSGIVSSMWIDVTSGGALALGNGTALVSWLGGPTANVMWSLFAAGVVLACMVATGLGGRWPAFLAAHVYWALTRTNSQVAGGYDAMVGNGLFLLFLSSASQTLSLDCRRKTGRWTDSTPAPAWPRYLLIFQLLVIYGSTGLQKIGPSWTPIGGYSALYWVYQDPTWRRFDMDWTASVYPALQVATALTWLWEVTAPLLLIHYLVRSLSPEGGGRIRAFIRRYDWRKPFAAVGILLHLGIVFTLNVGPFSFISLAYYLLLLRPDELRAASVRLARRTARPTVVPDGDRVVRQNVGGDTSTRRC